MSRCAEATDVRDFSVEHIQWRTRLPFKLNRHGPGASTIPAFFDRREDAEAAGREWIRRGHWH